jgi:glutathione S-transferase
MMTPLTFLTVFKTIREKVPWVIRPIIGAVFNNVESSWLMPGIKKQLLFIETHLQSNSFFCGTTFSAADVQMSFPIEAAALGGLIPASEVGPKTKEWLAKMQARDAYKTALEKGGPYSLTS